MTSDVWSLGVTLLELSTGLFPFAYSGQLLRRRTESSEYGLASIAIVELLEAIINDPLPSLDPSHFTAELCDFIKACLNRDPAQRPTPMQLTVFTF